MYMVRKLFKFEAAHQLASAVSVACFETIHGHSYRVELFLASPGLDTNGMVLDFGGMCHFKTWLLDYFDHALFIPAVFPLAYIEALRTYNVKLRVVEANPTAEWMARFIAADAERRFPGMVTKVRVHETDTGYAEYSL